MAINNPFTCEANYELGPCKWMQVLWSGAVGSDIDATKNGRCPKSLRVGSVGTLVCNMIDGTSVTLAAGHMNVAAPPIEIGTIISFTASGSTAFNLLLGY